MSATFFSSYLAGGMRANLFYPLGFGDAADRKRRVRDAAERSLSPGLATVLAEQNGVLTIAQKTHLSALEAGGAAAVLTGQQVGLFLGPLYTYYKAASAVVTARRLAEECGVPVVPVFWLQTEDHDFAEVASCYLPGESSSVKLSIASDVGRISLAHRRLGDDVLTALGALDEAIAGLSHARDVSDLLRAHYRPGMSIAGAFAGLLSALFSDEGLLVFNPRDARVAKLAAPLFRRAIREQPSIDDVLHAQRQRLEAEGLPEKVPSRPGSPLLFFHVDSASGPRFRFERGDRGFSLAGDSGRFEEDEISRLIEGEPLRFSTSALLRPLLQDTLFPTAAYVGGPGELEYFAQLPPLYEHLGLAPPLLVPRARFRLISSAARTLLGALELEPFEVEVAREALYAQLAARAPLAFERPSRAWLNELEARFSQLEKQAASFDPGLPRVLARTRRTLEGAVARLARRTERAIVTRDETLVGRLERLRGWLFPDGEPQERRFGFAAFAARIGLNELRRRILDGIEPIDGSVRDIDV
jgi:bacillithiol biosynthesis cysteine-adding enzyme BshC